MKYNLDSKDSFLYGTEILLKQDNLNIADADNFVSALYHAERQSSFRDVLSGIWEPGNQLLSYGWRKVSSWQDYSKLQLA